MCLFQMVTRDAFEQRKADMFLSGASLADLAALRHELPPVSEGVLRVQAVGYLPSAHHPMEPEFVYVVDTEKRIWLLDDINKPYVMDMMALCHGGGCRPFPTDGEVLEDGRLTLKRCQRSP